MVDKLLATNFQAIGVLPMYMHLFYSKETNNFNCNTNFIHFFFFMINKAFVKVTVSDILSPPSLMVD